MDDLAGFFSKKNNDPGLSIENSKGVGLLLTEKGKQTLITDNI